MEGKRAREGKGEGGWGVCQAEAGKGVSCQRAGKKTGRMLWWTRWQQVRMWSASSAVK